MANKKTQYVTFWFLLIFAGSLIALLNIKFPSVVEGLYAKGEIGLLRTISFTGEKEIRPLDYYVGKIEDVWVGPLTSVVAGGLLLFFCMLFLQGAGAVEFGAATLLYLLIAKFYVLFYPPYGDGLFGVLSEPLWLIRHHLDWLGLAQQRPYPLTGPLLYPESIYPKFIALLMYFSPSPKAFLFINHCLVFFAGATLVAAIREILLEFFDEKRATLGGRRI